MEWRRFCWFVALPLILLGSSLTGIVAAAGELDAANVSVFDMRNQSHFALAMTAVATTPDGYDFGEATLTAGDETIIFPYRFILQRGGKTLYYEDDTVDDNGVYSVIRKGGVGALYTVSRDATYQLAVYDHEFYTPEWARNAIFYQIFPDRFRDGDPADNPENGSDMFYGNLPL